MQGSQKQSVSRCCMNKIDEFSILGVDRGNEGHMGKQGFMGAVLRA